MAADRPKTFQVHGIERERYRVLRMDLQRSWFGLPHLSRTQLHSRLHHGGRHPGLRRGQVQQGEDVDRVHRGVCSGHHHVRFRQGVLATRHTEDDHGRGVSFIEEPNPEFRNSTPNFRQGVGVQPPGDGDTLGHIPRGEASPSHVAVQLGDIRGVRHSLSDRAVHSSVEHLGSGKMCHVGKISRRDATNGTVVVCYRGGGSRTTGRG